MAQIPKLDHRTLELLGLKSKDMDVYIALLRLGTAPLRRIAEEANLNRGTTYDALKRLIDVGLASYVDAKTHRYFTGEDPHKLRGLATRREVAIKEARLALDDVLPELSKIAGARKHRPVVRYFEGESGVREILRDVLETAERAETKEYCVYSTQDVRGLIKKAWPNFTRERIKRKIQVRAIAIGEGGIEAALSERKWIAAEQSAGMTYIFVYEGKTAFVSLDERDQLFGVIIEGEQIAATQALIFAAHFQTL